MIAIPVHEPEEIDPVKAGVPYQNANSIETGFPVRGTYDMSRTVFMGQTLLMQKYQEIERRNGEPMPAECDFGDLDSRIVQMRLHSIFGYMVREMSEAMAHLDAKPWKDNPRPVNKEAFFEEIADTYHLFVEFCIVAGLGSQKLFDEYFRAWEKNRDRQASGY